MRFISYAAFAMAAVTNAADDKVKITLYYESQCPDCRNTILGSFVTAYKVPDFLEMAEITYVPYGNASESPSPTV